MATAEATAGAPGGSAKETRDGAPAGSGGKQGAQSAGEVGAGDHAPSGGLAGEWKAASGSRRGSRVGSASWRQKLKELEDTKAAAHNLQVQLDQTRAYAEALQGKVAELEAGRFSATQGVAELSAALDAERKRSAAAHAALGEVDGRIRGAEQRVVDSEREAARLRSEAAAAAGRASELQRALNEKSGADGRVVEELEKAREKLKELEQEKRDMSKHFWQLAEESKSLKAKVEAANNERQAAKEAAEAAHAGTKKHLRRAEAAEAATKKLEEALELARRETAAQEKAAADANAALTRAQHEHKAALSRARTELGDKDSELADALAQNEAMQQQMTDFLRRADSMIEEQKQSVAKAEEARRTQEEDAAKTINELQTQLVRVRAEAQKAAGERIAEIDVLTANLAASNKRATQAVKAGKDAEARAKQAEDAAAAAMADIKAQSERDARRAEEAENEAKLLKVRDEERTAALTKAEKALATAREAAEAAAGTSATREAEIMDLRRRLREAEEAGRVVDRDGQELAARLSAELKAARDGLASERENAKKAAARHRAAMEGLEADKRDLILEANALNKDLGARAEAEKALRDAANAAETRANLAEAERAKERDEYKEEIVSALRERDNANAKAQAAGERLVEALREADAAKSSERDTKKELAAQAVAFSEKTTALNADAEHWAKVASEAQDAAKKLREETVAARKNAQAHEGELRRTRAEQRKESDMYQSQMESLKARVEDQDGVVRELRQLLDKAHADVAKAREDGNRLRMSSKEVTRGLATYEKQAKAASEAARQAKKELEAERASFAETKQLLEERVRDAEAEIVRRDAERNAAVEELAKRLADMDTALAEARQRADAATAENARLAAAQEEAAARIATVQQQAQGTIQNLVGELKTADSSAAMERDRLSGEVDAAYKRAEELKRELKRVIKRESDALDGAKRAAADTQNELVRLKAVVKAKDVEIDRLMDECNAAREESETIRRRAAADAAERDEALRELERETDEANQKDGEWKQTELRLRADLQAMSKRVAELTSELTSLQHSTQWHDTETKLEAEELAKTVEGMKAELKRKSSEIVAAESRATEARKALTAMQSAANTSMEELRRKLTEVSTTSAMELEAARAETAHMKSVAEKTARVLRQVEASERSLRATIDRMEADSAAASVRGGHMPNTGGLGPLRSFLSARSAQSRQSIADLDAESVLSDRTAPSARSAPAAGKATVPPLRGIGGAPLPDIADGDEAVLAARTSDRLSPPRTLPPVKDDAAPSTPHRPPHSPIAESERRRRAGDLSVTPSVVDEEASGAALDASKSAGEVPESISPERRPPQATAPPDRSGLQAQLRAWEQTLHAPMMPVAGAPVAPAAMFSTSRPAAGSAALAGPTAVTAESAALPAAAAAAATAEAHLRAEAHARAQAQAQAHAHAQARARAAAAQEQANAHAAEQQLQQHLEHRDDGSAEPDHAVHQTLPPDTRGSLRDAAVAGPGTDSRASTATVGGAAERSIRDIDAFLSRRRYKDGDGADNGADPYESVHHEGGGASHGEPMAAHEDEDGGSQEARRWAQGEAFVSGDASGSVRSGLGGQGRDLPPRSKTVQGPPRRASAGRASSATAGTGKRTGRKRPPSAESAHSAGSGSSGKGNAGRGGAAAGTRGVTGVVRAPLKKAGSGRHAVKRQQLFPRIDR